MPAHTPAPFASTTKVRARATPRDAAQPFAVFPEEPPALGDAVNCKDLHGFENDFRVASEDPAVECKEMQGFRDDFQSYTSPPPHAGAADFTTPWDNDVKDWQPTRGLSEQQKTAIDLMLRGVKLERIAEQLGIHRGTLWRWRRFDQLFRTALAFGRAKAYQHATEQLRELVPRAVHIIQSQLEGDDHRAAFQLLRLVAIGRDAMDTL